MGDPVFPDLGNPGYDAQRYRWDITVDPSSGELSLIATMEAVARAALANVALDYTGPPLAQVFLDGDSVQFDVVDGKLIVGAAVAEGAAYALTTEYRGLPDPATTVGMPDRFGWIATTGKIRTLAVFPGNTASWVPLNDTPLDPATYEIAISVPNPYVATASGELSGVTKEGGSTVFRWVVDQPVTEVTLAIGEFVIHEVEGPPGVSIDIALPIDETAVMANDFAGVPEMIEFLSRWMGPFPFSGIGFTWVGGGGADSTPGRINLGSTSSLLLVHELAHQWIGGSVGTASTADAWLREGLPTYFEDLWVVTEGTNSLDALANRRRQLLGNSTRAPLDVTRPFDRVDAVTYDRGALVFHALHAELGDDRFAEALQGFVTKFSGESAHTDDFIETVSELTSRDLSDFFNRWLRMQELPVS